ncbi:hypothetical protein WJX81_005676 [Elliptochloris bilobata]|uniref:Peptidase C1A papain C-terminal domain-containing protein n=1 Tax=Elliptochloris bilobata TaxID=381761 RepID=A0AAW1SDB4_9CHLO
MIQDRLKIAKAGRGPDVLLSRQTMLNCGAFEGNGAGCDGGDPIDVFKYMVKFGLPDNTCLSYSATDHTRFNKTGDVKHCPPLAICENCMPLPPNGTETCWAVKTPILYKLNSWHKIQNGSHGQEVAMMNEIYQKGPIVCSISTPEDFTYGYRAGIWPDEKTKFDDIDHNVEVVGWGEEDGTPFWVIRNSWGSFWGELGFFRLQRSVNSFWLENGDCWAAEPEFKMEQACGELQNKTNMELRKKTYKRR